MEICQTHCKPRSMKGIRRIFKRKRKRKTISNYGPINNVLRHEKPNSIGIQTLCQPTGDQTSTIIELRAEEAQTKRYFEIWNRF